MAKRNSEHTGFVSLSRQPATADWTVATIKLAMEQEPEGDIEAVLSYVACKAKHRSSGLDSLTTWPQARSVAS
jgi:hypothetical protein